MGCPISKPTEHKPSALRKKIVSADIDAGYKTSTVKMLDEAEVDTITVDLTVEPKYFLLNNIFLCMMFYENYKKDLESLWFKSNIKKELQLNQTSLKTETVNGFTPDVVFENVNKNVRFRPLHGPKKEKAETLISSRIYVINDIIDVVNNFDEAIHYTTIDKPSYYVVLESSKHKGYMKLKLISPRTNDDQKSEDQVTVRPTKVHIILPEPMPSTSAASDSDYEYNTITELNTPKPIEVLEEPQRKNTLPNSCFTNREVKKLDSDSDSDELFETVSYIASKGFRRYFETEVFPKSVGRALNFHQNEIDEARVLADKIICNQLDEDDNPKTCEIYPCVSLKEWPEEAYEFKQREERPAVFPNNKNMVPLHGYKWPTDEMIQDIMSLSYVLVPKGHYPKKGVNPDADLEWEIQFPKAERYLLTRMTHAQIRCFLFLLAIHKTYIEPYTGHNGLLVGHLRTHMFWEVEKNYFNWPEHQLGRKLIRIIENLYTKLSEGVLPDFFIKERNLLQNVPNKNIRLAAKVFHNIIELPVMYLLDALRNIRYTSGRFYPTLDFKELYKCLVQDGMKSTNPNLMISNPVSIPQKSHVDKETQWKINQRRKIREQKARKKEEDNLKMSNEKKVSVSSINVEWNCDKVDDLLKLRQILQIFIHKYLEIVAKSRQIASKQQTYFYLKQASYLITIFESQASGFEHDVIDIKAIFHEEEALYNKMVECPDLPPTPSRNSVQKFHFDRTQQVQNSTIRLQNLSNSYNNGFLKQRVK